jgi:hydrogenase/urease accessory protein HupE
MRWGHYYQPTFRLLVLLLGLSVYHVSLADELRPAFLQLTQISADTIKVDWKVPTKGERRMALGVSFNNATPLETQPFLTILAGSTLSSWQIQRPQGLLGLTTQIDNLVNTNAEVLMRVEFLDGQSISHRFDPTDAQFTIPNTMKNIDSTLTYFTLGVEHILIGWDHLLFVLGLFLIVANTKQLLLTITSFTLAHSITLALSIFDIVRIPIRPVEAVIALSIVFLASEIVKHRPLMPSLSYRQPYIVAWLFGLLHGLGFASVLNEIGLPQTDKISALVLFNLGVETGQILFIGVLIAIFYVLKRLLAHQLQQMIHVFAYAMGSMASFWLIQRLLSF